MWKIFSLFSKRNSHQRNWLNKKLSNFAKLKFPDTKINLMSGNFVDGCNDESTILFDDSNLSLLERLNMIWRLAKGLDLPKFWPYGRLKGPKIENDAPKNFVLLSLRLCTKINRWTDDMNKSLNTNFASLSSTKCFFFVNLH